MLAYGQPCITIVHLWGFHYEFCAMVVHNYFNARQFPLNRLPEYEHADLSRDLSVKPD